MTETPDHVPNPITRRGFLLGTIAAALAACTDDGDGDTASSSTTTTSTAPTGPPVVDTDPFALGVASGDPLDDSVILWTRLVAPDLPAKVGVAWEVATDAAMSEVVASGSGDALATLGHSVHVDASGLDPDTEYWYRFSLDGFETTPARTRTFAAAGTTADRFRFAYSSCQNWEQGYYAAYRDLVEQDAVDAFVFLGDYIYEYATGGYSDDRGRQTGQEFECTTLDEYRQRYALYRSDPLLQAAHALVPWIITWDDHEVDNDYAGATSQDDDDTETFLDRRAAAYQAWYEFMPVRLEPPTGPDLDIYRSFAHGDLIRFHVLDTRQYRADQQRSEPFVDALGSAVQERDETLADSLDQSLLGTAQREWLLEGAQASTAVWDVLAQQVFMFGGNAVPDADPPVIVVDTWDGYAAERLVVVKGMAATTDNFVVLTGDFHSAAVADLRVDPFDQSLPVVGTELMATSISSSFFDDDAVVEALVGAALSANPQLKWFDASRGYTHCEVTPDRWVATFRQVEDQFDPDSPVVVASTWEIAAGTPGAVRTD